MTVITSLRRLPSGENDLAVAERVLPPHLLDLTQGLSRHVDQRFPHVRASRQAVVCLANGCTVSVLGGLPDLERYGPYVAAVIGPFGHLIANHTRLTADEVIAIVNEAAALPVVGHG